MRDTIVGKVFKRMETDAELLERVRVKLAWANKPIVPLGETADHVAERHGLTRRLVEDETCRR